MSNNASPSYLEQFRAKARAWAKDVVELVDTPVPPGSELATQKARLLKWAEYIKKGIEMIFGTMDELDNVGLGFVFPLVPVAIVAGSLAAIVKWTYDYKTFKRGIAEQQRLEAKGYSSPEAARMVASKKSSLFNFNYRSPVTLLLLGVGGWFLYNKVR